MTTTNPSAIEHNVPASFWHRRSIQLAALVVLVCIGASLRIANLSSVRDRTPDERNYTWEAAALANNGNAAFATIADAFHKDISLPGPTRAGYLELAAFAMRLTGQQDVTAIVSLSCAASVISLLLVAWIGWRFFSPLVALAAVALYACSPLALMTSRRAWEEAVVEALVLTLLFLAFEMIRDSTRRIRFPLLALGFALIGGFTLTVKETPAASFFLITLGVLAVLLLRRDFRSAMIFALACCLTSLVALAWLAHLVGGLHALAQMSTTTAAFLQTSPYSIEYEAGPPWQLLHGLFLLSAAGSVFFAVSLPYAFTPKRPVAPQRQMLLGLAVFTIFFLLLAAFLPHHLNLRYVCAVYGPIYLLAGVGLTHVFIWLRAAAIPENALIPALAAVVLLAGILDYRGFLNNFAAPDVQDLSIRMVLAAENSPLPPSAATPAPAGLPTLDANKALANNWINTSNSLQQAGLCQQALDAARKAVGLDPSNPIAWNNIAAGNECLHQWQPAIDAAMQALKLQPDFQLARNNLMWSLEQQRKDASK